jgi:hypothetical protein
VIHRSDVPRARIVHPGNVEEEGDSPQRASKAGRVEEVDTVGIGTEGGHDRGGGVASHEGANTAALSHETRDEMSADESRSAREGDVRCHGRRSRTRT